MTAQALEALQLYRNGTLIRSLVPQDVAPGVREGTIRLADQIQASGERKTVEAWLLSQAPDLAAHPLFKTPATALPGALPAEVLGLCWGGWGWGILWLLRHRLWGLIVFWLGATFISIYNDLSDPLPGLPGVAFVELLFGLFLLFRGRELAWRKGIWQEPAAFARSQRRWGVTGFLVGVIAYAGFGFTLWNVGQLSQPEIKLSPDELMAAVAEQNDNRHLRNTLGLIRWTLGEPERSACGLTADGQRECRLLYSGRLVQDPAEFARLKQRWSDLPGDASEKQDAYDEAVAQLDRWFELRFVAEPHRWFGTLVPEWTWDGRIVRSGKALPPELGHDLSLPLCRLRGSESGTLSFVLSRPTWVLVGQGMGRDFSAARYLQLDPGTHHLTLPVPFEVYVEDAAAAELYYYGQRLKAQERLAGADHLHFQLSPLIGRCPTKD